MTKVCVKCGVEKSIDDFYKAKGGKDGLRTDCKACSKLRAKKHHQENKERNYQKHLEWCAENPNRARELKRSAQRAHHSRNLDKHAARQAQRRADKLQRTPAWADREAIKCFYLNRPEGHHVDHIVPLKGQTVSGLHVLDNLQYLPAQENMRKSNKL